MKRPFQIVFKSDSRNAQRKRLEALWARTIGESLLAKRDNDCLDDAGFLICVYRMQVNDESAMHAQGYGCRQQRLPFRAG